MRLGFLNDYPIIKSRYLQDQISNNLLLADEISKKLQSRNFLTYGVDAKLILFLVLIIQGKKLNLMNKEKQAIPYNYKYCIEQLLKHKPIASDFKYFLQAGKCIDTLSRIEDSIAR